MKVELAPTTAVRVDDLLGVLSRLTAAIEANTAALQERTAQHDIELNGPRG